MKLKTLTIIATSIFFGLTSTASANIDADGWSTVNNHVNRLKTKIISESSGSCTNNTPCNPADQFTTTFTPLDADLHDLPHGSVFKVKINWDLPSNEVIIGASLTFKQIRNWDNNQSTLFVDLLNTSSAHSKVLEITNDVGGQHDYFNPDPLKPEDSIRLAKYTDLKYANGPQTKVLNFDEVDGALDALRSYLADDGSFGLGIDPDCHFWNEGVQLSIITECATSSNPVPEPTTMLLFGTGLAGLAGLQSRRKNKIS